MVDMHLYWVGDGKAVEFPAAVAGAEAELARLLQANLGPLFGVRLVVASHRVETARGGVIDALGLDAEGAPVVLAFRRYGDHGLVAQGLDHLGWVLQSRAEFRSLAERGLGRRAAQGIDWAGARLVCVAAAFTADDESLVEQSGRPVELVRYRLYGERRLLGLETVSTCGLTRPGGGTGELGTRRKRKRKTPPTKPPTPVGAWVVDRLARSPAEVVALYERLEGFAFGLGDDVTKKVTKHYVVFRRRRNFLCVKVGVRQPSLVLSVGVDPDMVPLERGYSRDLRGQGHLGTGNLELRVQDSDDLDRAEDLLREAYERN